MESAVNVEMIGVIIVGGLAIISFTKPFLDLKSILVRLEETMKNLERMMAYNQEKNEKEHDIFFTQLRELQEKLTKLHAEHHHIHANLLKGGNDEGHNK